MENKENMQVLTSEGKAKYEEELHYLKREEMDSLVFHFLLNHSLDLTLFIRF